jgi:uncharacterized membrane protein
MRLAIVIVGVILLIIGAVLLFVPLVPQQSTDLSATSPGAELNVSGFSIVGSVYFSMSWTSSAAVDFFAGVCSGGVSSSGNCSSIGATMTWLNSTSGTWSFTAKPGDSIGFGMVSSILLGGSSNATANVKITASLATVGSILLIVGIILLIVGLVLKKKVPPAPPSMMPQDTSGGMGMPPPSDPNPPMNPPS